MDFDGNSYVMHREPEPGWLVTISGAGARYCAGLTESGHEIPVEGFTYFQACANPPVTWPRMTRLVGGDLLTGIVFRRCTVDLCAFDHPVDDTLLHWVFGLAVG